MLYEVITQLLIDDVGNAVSILTQLFFGHLGREVRLDGSVPLGRGHGDRGARCGGGEAA